MIEKASTRFYWVHNWFREKIHEGGVKENIVYFLLKRLTKSMKIDCKMFNNIFNIFQICMFVAIFNSTLIEHVETYTTATIHPVDSLFSTLLLSILVFRGLFFFLHQIMCSLYWLFLLIFLFGKYGINH